MLKSPLKKLLLLQPPPPLPLLSAPCHGLVLNQHLFSVDFAINLNIRRGRFYYNKISRYQEEAYTMSDETC